MPDFTLKTYKELLNALIDQGFSFLPFEGYLKNSTEKTIVLRHDVDASPLNSLQFAKTQTKMDIAGTYYFRKVGESFDEKIIKEIFSMGHEVGYHYEDVSLIAERQKTKVKRQKFGSKGDYEKYLVELAVKSFKQNLELLSQIVPVKTICMHGSPMSKWDSRSLWKYYDYHDFGIIGEPYFDINFNEVLYLTDTGRRWDGGSVNIRDKAFNRKDSKESTEAAEQKLLATSNPQPATFPKFHSTVDIIKAAQEGKLPDKIMMTFHPQRWTDKPGPWIRELVWQNVKNIAKYFFVKRRN